MSIIKRATKVTGRSENKKLQQTNLLPVTAPDDDDDDDVDYQLTGTENISFL